MSTFANLVGAVVVALRTLNTVTTTTREGAALHLIAHGTAEPEQKALSFARHCLERCTGIFVDCLEPGRLQLLIDQHLDVAPLVSVEAEAALVWLRAFYDNVQKNKVALARVLSFEQHTSLPHVVTSALVRAHAGDFKLSTSASQVADDAGRISWRVAPNVRDDLVVVVPANNVKLRPSVGVRRALNGTVLRTWWATWELAFAQGTPEGFFHVDMRHVILDLFGQRPEYHTRRGRRYARPPRKTVKQVDGALATLGRVLVGGVGGMTVENPEALVHRYGKVREDGRVVRDRQYAHARLLWAARRRNFIQLPLAAFRLEPHDAPAAMGLATLLRSRAHEWVKGGTLTLTLHQIGIAIGEDVGAGLRRHGASYWSELRQRLERVVPDGGFGSVHFGNGLEGDAVVTIDLWLPLIAAYGDLGNGAATPSLSSSARRP